MIPKNKPMVTLQGYGQPMIDWNDAAFMTFNSTLDSATVGISGGYFMARNITFQVNTSALKDVNTHALSTCFCLPEMDSLLTIRAKWSVLLAVRTCSMQSGLKIPSFGCNRNSQISVSYIEIIMENDHFENM